MNCGKNDQLPDSPGFEIAVWARGHLDHCIKDCFAGMKITDNDDGTTSIEGRLADLPEVYGFIIRLRDTVVFLHSLQVRMIKEQGTV